MLHPAPALARWMLRKVKDPSIAQSNFAAWLATSISMLVTWGAATTMAWAHLGTNLWPAGLASVVAGSAVYGALAAASVRRSV